ncbi:hypothetical protein BIFDEN_01250 [Bifidobacterium dentium ATCC 27678]|nr:hypothetical protein BIFDEN_01250 [Bifidobacterium dentium ATCC 27678]
MRARDGRLPPSPSNHYMDISCSAKRFGNVVSIHCHALRNKP